MSSSEWAAVAIGVVILSLMLLVLTAALFKWNYQRKHAKKYQFDVILSTVSDRHIHDKRDRQNVHTWRDADRQKDKQLNHVFKPCFNS